MSKSVIFDFDGTIVDSFSMILSIYNNIASEYGANPLSATDVDELRDSEPAALFARAGVGPWKIIRIAKRIQHEMKQRASEIRAIEGMPELISTLAGEGYKVGVVTSNRSDIVTERLEAFGCRNDVSFIESAKRMRPKDKTLRRVMRAHGLVPERTAYVGDETRDVEAANRVGLRSVAVTWGFQTGSRLKQSKPTAIVESVEDWSKYLETL